MSTKTSFERIALVAIVELGFGMLSFASSSVANKSYGVGITSTVLSVIPTVGSEVNIMVNYKGFCVVNNTNI